MPLVVIQTVGFHFNTLGRIAEDGVSSVLQISIVPFLRKHAAFKEEVSEKESTP